MKCSHLSNRCFAASIKKQNSRHKDLDIIRYYIRNEKMLNNHKCVEVHNIVANQATFDEYNL